VHGVAIKNKGTRLKIVHSCTRVRPTKHIQEPSSSTKPLRKLLLLYLYSIRTIVSIRFLILYIPIDSFTLVSSIGRIVVPKLLYMKSILIYAHLSGTHTQNLIAGTQIFLSENVPYRAYRQGSSGIKIFLVFQET
jgi:hypothetical protein